MGSRVSKFPFPLYRVLLRVVRSYDGVSIALVAKRSDTTYSHTSETLRLLESAGLVCCVSRGREQLFRLTESGVRVCCLFDEELGVVGKQFYDDKKGLL